ncbi:MAG: hypothetical protein KJ838_05180 [Candidatus Omnitrophica bacterium]|nr:hypothetical protein [Candidatus Omnitrophota bacterium]
MLHFQQKTSNLIKVFLIFLIFTSLSFAEQDREEDKLAGELFGVPVPMGNYYFAKRAVISFDAKWRGIPRDEEELEDLVWQELLFSFEAYRRGIEASDSEINQEVDKLLKVDKVEFDWKQDTDAFKQWVEEKLKEPIELFRNQIEHLVKLEKLRNQVLESIEPEATEEEAYQKFLDEYNSLGVELIQFEDSELEQAEILYNQAQSDPEAWDKKKEDNPKSYKNLTGPYALDFLINLWGFKREDAYAMMDIKDGEFYKPSPIYKGYGVFKIISTRKADPAEFEKRHDYYFDKIKTIKKYKGFKEWVETLKEQANIKRFIK